MLAKLSIIPYVVTVCVFLSVNKKDILELNSFRNITTYYIIMVDGILNTSSKVHNNAQIVWYFSSSMNKLVYIYVPNEFVIGQVVLKWFSKRLAIAMANKTVVIFLKHPSTHAVWQSECYCVYSRCHCP
jgi:hypothetical protein